MFAKCKGPIWGVDDFSRCFELDYLSTLFPLIVCGVSVIYLLIQLYFAATASKYYHVYSVLDDPLNVWSFRSPNYDGDAADTDSEDKFDRNEQSALLHPTISRQTMSTTAVTKPRGEVTIVVLEEAAVLAQLAIHVTVFFTNAWGRHGRTATIANIAVWSYIATLASLRLLFSSTSKWSFPKLWYHTAFIYGFQWLFSTLLFRSAIIHPLSDVQQKLAIADFVLNSLLFIISLTSRKGNKAVELEYEGDILPAREPIASVFSLATFSWVDSIVWTGYKKTYELSDVWNLAPKDKAAAVITNYRQVKRTSQLAYHLLGYFKRGLIIQAGWAAISGFLTFAPTLLLKAILEYVESPDLTPQNAAWFYVLLLFISGCLSALADGQALWIGRKICIRLRAVIIGEIYAKALKRRAAATTDKVLGEEKKKTDDTEPQGTIKKMVTWGRKKKKTPTEGPKQNDEDSAKPESDAQVTTGAIINLMAVDAFKVSEICAYLHFLWANTPVQVAVAVILLYSILGYSSIAGIGMMIILLPINMYVASQFSKIQKLILAATDARIHTTNEVLTNIRIIKYFAWEQRFIGLVNEKRYVELKHLRRRYILWAIAATIWSGSPVFITFLSFFVYTNVEHKALIPSVAFTALSLFQILRIPLDQLADMVAHVQESRVSVDRIEEYLNEPETEKYSQLTTSEKDDNGQSIIGFNKGTFSWGGKDMKDQASADAFKLMDVDIKFKVGHLNVVVGPTGSGKTSLLMALLGEMTKLKGDVYLPGGVSREDLRPDPETGLIESVAYCAQQAWLVNGTVKENIVFAGDWDADRYEQVIVACSLKRDLEILDGGDETIVGEKGVTLSGGQKQRISLARAMYSKARHVLLDDVLSAVDSHTAKWIFDYALNGELMLNRTCILVTHNVSLCLPYAEFAVVLENGRVVTQGTSDEVIDSGKLTEEVSKSSPASRGASKPPSRVPSDVGGEEAEGEVSHTNGSANGKANGKDPKKGASNPLEETKAEGGVKLSIILMYLKAMGPWYYWVGAFIAFVAQQISSVSTNLWIRTWANAYAEKGVSTMGHHNRSPITHAPTMFGSGTCLNSGTCSWNIPFMSQPEEKSYIYSSTMQTTFGSSDDSGVDSTYFLVIYAILGLIFMFITFLREGFLFGGSLAASRRVHERLIQKVTHAKFRFFDQTPLGQLMNRFSKDIESVDQEVAPVAIGVVHCLASIITIVILISVITPAFLIAGIFISVLYFLIGRFYINSSRDLKRLESVHRSPLYQQFGETLSGMTTIRAYGDERRFIRENLAKINTQHRPFIYLWAANRWLAFRVDVVGALVAFFAGTFVVLSVGKIDAGAAGLALTYAVTFTENVLWFVRLYSANEQNMNSVERVKEYLDVEQEAPAVIHETKPPSNWPSKGSVEFINYSTRYRPDFDPVLKNVTFKILPGEKVGVVGRTGAGKSSLALALFRALEAEKGKILIDDIDVGLIGLQDLRESIVMVPQDPTLFTGTVRSNLDPFSVFTDEEIRTVLREVHLISSASTATSGAGTPTRVATPPNAIEIPKPTTGAVTADVNASYTGASTVNPGSILANREWTQGETGDETIVVMPDGQVVDPDMAAINALQADNKNPFTNLNSLISESGSNLSQGQRQLLCLARALLKTPKVLLMDEATASIDYATDTKIQETIRQIKNTTVTIAHRLQTIIDYDKVLVLDKGEVIEFGDPHTLITKEGGNFRSMCETSGELDSLTKTAKEAQDAKALLSV